MRDLATEWNQLLRCRATDRTQSGVTVETHHHHHILSLALSCAQRCVYAIRMCSSIKVTDSRRTSSSNSSRLTYINQLSWAHSGHAKTATQCVAQVHLEARPEVEVSGNGNRFRSSLFPFPFRFPVLQQRLLRLRLRQRVASLVCRRSFLNKFNSLFFRFGHDNRLETGISHSDCVCVCH